MPTVVGMEWLVLCLAVAGLAFVLVGRWVGSTVAPPPARRQVTQQQTRRGSLFEIEAEAPPATPGAEPDVGERTVRFPGEVRDEATRVAGTDPDPVSGAEPTPRETLTRRDFVPKEDEAQYLARSTDGSLDLRLVDAGDRLAIWSPVEGGGLINPKGPGLRSLGLYSSHARGADHYRAAYRSADLRHGQWIDLKREPQNSHDKNAVAMRAPGSSRTIGYVQRGRAPAVAKRMDAGEDLAAVSMRGPGRGRGDDTTLVIIGSRTDLTTMLSL